jgi:hypothetical protein
MKYRWEEINQMRDFLEAEIHGHSFDREHARRTALHIAEKFPDCAQSMNQIADRLNSRS